MVRCPKCFKPVEDPDQCSYCVKLNSHSSAELFDKLGEAVENELRKERQKRKKKKTIKLLAVIVIVLFALYVGKRLSI